MRKILFSLILLSNLFFFTTALAEISLNLYEKPDTTTKAITTIKSGNQFIPFFYTPFKDWVKVALPQSGEVGWVKISDLATIKKTTGSNSQQQTATSTQTLPFETPASIFPGNLKPGNIEQIRTSLQNLQNIFKDFALGFYAIPIYQLVIIVPDNSNGKTNNSKTQ